MIYSLTMPIVLRGRWFLKERKNMKYPMLIAAILASTLAIGSARADCYGMLDSDHEDVKRSNEKLLAGNYEDFIGVIGNIISAPKDNFDAVVEPFLRYFPEGFDKCRILARKNYSESMSSYLFEFSKSGSIVYLYEVALNGAGGFDSGVIQVQVTTNFNEIFDYFD